MYNKRILAKRQALSLGNGTFFLFEGIDRSGKTTQCRRLVEALSLRGLDVLHLAFPDRATATGKVIAAYLAREIELPIEAAHLLFAANRWERA